MHEQVTSSATQAPRPEFQDAGDAERVRVVASFEARELEDDPELLGIVRFAARLCRAPVAQISLVEAECQRFLAGEGFDAREVPRTSSICTHAMLGDGLMEVHDLAASELFADNPFVTGPTAIRFYAGQPLVAEDGSPLGALCVIDTAPRPAGLDALQRQGLEVLAGAVMRRLTAHRETLRANRAIAEREEQLHILADAMPAIVWSADPSGTFDYFNKGLIDFIGAADGTGSAFHPDDWVRCNAAWQHSLATGDPYEVEHRMRHVDGRYRWMLARAIPMRDADGTIVRWFGTAVDIDNVHKLSEARDLLSRELAHRIKNIFAVVIGLVSLEARRRPEHRDFAAALTGTLRALGRAHEFVRPAGGSAPGGLKGLLEVLFAPYGGEGEAQVRVAGAEPAISTRAATPLALVFHELATNSAKYGALSVDHGLVTLDIAEHDETLRLVWREQGGPPLPADAAAALAGGETGFGSRLVEMSVTGQLGGSWVRRFEPEGLVVELTIAKQAIAP